MTPLATRRARIARLAAKRPAPAVEVVRVESADARERLARILAEVAAEARTS